LIVRAWRGAIIAVVLAAVASASVARADVVLGQFVGSLGFGYTDGTPLGSTYLVFQVDPQPQGQVAAQPSLFENILVSPAVVGQEFFATNDPDLPVIAAKLTNGVDDLVFMWNFEGPAISGRGSAAPRLESQYLGAAGQPDLTGLSITAMSLTVTSYRTGVVDLLGLADFVDYTVTAYGVPEPSSWAIGLVAAGVLHRRRRKRRRLPYPR
jgi:hypothetical protein